MYIFTNEFLWTRALKKVHNTSDSNSGQVFANFVLAKKRDTLWKVEIFGELKNDFNFNRFVS